MNPVVLSSSVSPSVYMFSVSAVPREKTPCHCKESVFVYGGRNASTGAWSNDLWELRCVDDSDVLRYQWIKVPKKSAASLWPPTIVNPISFSIKEEMYVLGGYTKSSYISGRIDGVWKFDLNTSTWTLTETPPFYRLQTAAVFLTHMKVLMFLDNNETATTFYDVAKNSITTSKLGDWFGRNDIVRFDPIANSMQGIGIEGAVLLMGPINHSENLEAWIIRKTQLENIKTMLASRKRTLKVIIDSIYPPQLAPSGINIIINMGKGEAACSTALFVGNYFFAMNLNENEFWKLDLKNSMWTQYDHEREPDFYNAVVASFGSNHLVAFGKEKQIATSKYELRIYTVSQRLWTIPEEQTEDRPPNQRYSTLTVWQNTSLILCGRGGNVADLWILTVYTSNMTVAWNRLATASKGSMFHPSLHSYISLLEIQSSVVGNTLYVYGGWLKNESCNLDVTQITINKSAASFEAGKLRADNCVQQGQVIGSYLFYTQHVQSSSSLQINLT